MALAQVLTFKAPKLIAFDHRFFASFADACFRIDEAEGVPVFAFGLGQQKVALPFGGIKREFSLREYGNDGLMLNTIERGLRFVGLLRVGDPIPPEVLTGDASWEQGENHRTAARNRLGAQLVGWHLGHRVALGDPVGIEKFIAHHVNEISIDDALSHMAIELGQAGDGDGMIADVMAAAVEELSYIEALRERYLAVCRIGERLQKLRREFAHHAGTVDEVEPVVRLISIPIRSLGLSLTEVDARLASIMSLFCDFTFHRNALRDIRDDMYIRLNPWDEIIADWGRLSGNITDPYSVTPLLRDLYRFLAPRFMPADTWALILANAGNLDENRQYGNVTTWYSRGSHAA